MGDARDCYDYLLKNVPLWTRELKEVADKVEKARIRNATISDPAVDLSENNCNGDNSMETLRPAEDNNEGTDVHSSSSTPVSTTPCQTKVPPPTDIKAIHSPPILCKRKRVSSTLASGHVARSTRYRTKSSTLVTYDSETQKSFESMVRSIGAGRNMIRKAIIAARIAKAAAAATHMDDNDDDEDGFKDASLVLAKLGHRAKFGRIEARGVRMTCTNRNKSIDKDDKRNGPEALDGSESFDLLDRTLEKAQNQCERGAHQLLRDGDCSEEIDSILSWFQEILTICEKELSKISNENEKVGDEMLKRRSPGQPRGRDHIALSAKCNNIDLKIMPKTFENPVKNTIDVKIEPKSFEPRNESVDIKLDADHDSSKGGACIKSNTLVGAV